jgi:hypothetical protein
MPPVVPPTTVASTPRKKFWRRPGGVSKQVEVAGATLKLADTGVPESAVLQIDGAVTVTVAIVSVFPLVQSCWNATCTCSDTGGLLSFQI